MNLRRLLVCVLILCTSALKGLCEDDRLGKLVATLQAIEAKLDARIEEDSAAILSAYEQKLDGLVRHYQQKGELEALLAVRKEAERAQAEKIIPAKTADSPKELILLQRKTLSQLSYREQAIERERLNSYKYYIRHLETLQRDLVKANRIESALAVSEETKRAATAIARIERALPLQGAKKTSPPGLRSPATARQNYEWSFDGFDLKEFKASGEGLLAEKKGSLVPMEYGQGGKHHGPVGIIEVDISGDYRLEAVFDYHSAGSEMGYIKVFARLVDGHIIEFTLRDAHTRDIEYVYGLNAGEGKTWSSSFVRSNTPIILDGVKVMMERRGSSLTLNVNGKRQTILNGVSQADISGIGIGFTQFATYPPLTECSCRELRVTSLL